MEKNTAVYGIFEGENQAEGAVAALMNGGFRNSDLSVLFSSPDTKGNLILENDTKSPEGPTTGTGTGAVIGGTLGWLAGIGAIAIPGVGPFIAAGPLLALLAGVGVGGALGSLTGALKFLGIPEYEAKRYESRVSQGGVLLSVHTNSPKWTKRAKEILEQSGAEDLGSKVEASADTKRDTSKNSDTRSLGNH